MFSNFGCNRMDVNPKGRTNSVELLGFLGTVEENTWHFEILLLFLSLWYGADMGRSRLVFSRRILSKWARLLQWQVFFRQTTECMRSGHFLQNYQTTGPASGNASKLGQRVPLLCTQFLTKDTKPDGTTGSTLWIFFGTVRLFLDFFCRQRVLPSSFLIFCSKLKFQKAQKGLLFLLFRHYETVPKISFAVTASSGTAISTDFATRHVQKFCWKFVQIWRGTQPCSRWKTCQKSIPEEQKSPPAKNERKRRPKRRLFRL